MFLHGAKSCIEVFKKLHLVVSLFSDRNTKLDVICHIFEVQRWNFARGHIFQWCKIVDHFFSKKGHLVARLFYDRNPKLDANCHIFELEPWNFACGHIFLTQNCTYFFCKKRHLVARLLSDQNKKTGCHLPNFWARTLKFCIWAYFLMA